jgi:hypothetical protein
MAELKRTYHKNGNLRGEIFLVNGKKEGSYKEYFENGSLMFFGNFMNDCLNGEYKIWYNNGKLIHHKLYKNGKLIKFIDNPSEEVQLAAVKKLGSSIQYIQNPSEKVQLAVIEQDPYSIRFIENTSGKVKQLARSKGKKVKMSADDEAQDYYTFGKHKI